MKRSGAKPQDRQSDVEPAIPAPESVEPSFDTEVRDSGPTGPLPSASDPDAPYGAFGDSSGVTAVYPPQQDVVEIERETFPRDPDAAGTPSDSPPDDSVSEDAPGESESDVPEEGMGPHLQENCWCGKEHGPHLQQNCWCGEEHTSGICEICGEPLAEGEYFHYHGH